jgi:hypothetical protein
MLTDLFGAKLHAVMGYPGSADKRVAIERGELDGDCGSWTSMPEDWLRDRKITLLIRFSRNLAPGMPADLPYAGDLLTDPSKTSRCWAPAPWSAAPSSRRAPSPPTD